MKGRRIRIYILATATSLLGLLGIQVHWILRSAEMKEAIFNEKALMVLARTTEALNADGKTSTRIADCVSACSEVGKPAQLGRNEAFIVDSLFRHYMRQYHLTVAYQYSVAQPGVATRASDAGLGKYMYHQLLASSAGRGGAEIKLILPGKRHYILAELGVPFLTSVVLVVVVLLLFWFTVVGLEKEKAISERTAGFLNNMTHEFKTPITNIALAGKMLQRDHVQPQSGRTTDYISIILKENDKLKNQVEQVLGLSALEYGDISIVKNRVDFHSLIGEALEQVKMQLEVSEAIVQVELRAANHLIKGDKSHLINAICNMLDNAIKYASGRPHITLSTWNENALFMVSVTDAGIGIEPHYQKFVFDKYYRVPTGNVHNVKGFGLGLAYVKHIVEQHGGQILLQSAAGKGTTFRISIPNG